MIIGVTHDQDGRVVQRLSVSTKVSIGLPPNGDCNHPTKLDHFVFLRKKKSSNRVGWEADPELTEHYGEECCELHIMLIDDDIENVFPSSYAWWTATERKCWGDGMSAMRRTCEKPGGEPWASCGSGCPDLLSGQCKPSGDLRFVLADFPRLGSICRIHTCSYRSIRQIHSALQEIQTFTGGRLAGITAKLTVRPEEATYFDRKEKRKKTSSIWALSLEVEGDDMRKLIANLTENVRLFAETRRLLGSGGKVLEVVEDEQEQAPEVTAEFYPASLNGPSATESTEAAPLTDATAGSAPSKSPSETPPPGNGTRVSGGNGSGKPCAGNLIMSSFFRENG
jgi:hypothetical protein